MYNKNIQLHNKIKMLLEQTDIETVYDNYPPLPPEETKFVKGDFAYIENSNEREMLQNAWNAITQLELWNYMKQNCESYMLSSDNEITIITHKMEELGYNGHSGFSFGWTMRQMQYIAQYGEEQYFKSRLNKT